MSPVSLKALNRNTNSENRHWLPMILSKKNFSMYICTINLSCSYKGGPVSKKHVIFRLADCEYEVLAWNQPRCRLSPKQDDVHIDRAFLAHIYHGDITAGVSCAVGTPPLLSTLILADETALTFTARGGRGLG